MRSILKQVPGMMRGYRATRSALDFVANRGKMLVAPSQMRGATKLHLGAGFRQIPGWANIDLSGPNIIWDLTKRLPLNPNSVLFVYSEHFLEHVTRPQALSLLRNVREVLAPTGVVRISTPDLATLAKDYLEGKLVSLPSYQWEPETLCQMVNEAFRSWGHQFLYDEAELTGVLQEAGFRTVTRVKWRQSESPELTGLETRPDLGDLLLEAKA